MKPIDNLFKFQDYKKDYQKGRRNIFLQYLVIIISKLNEFTDWITLKIKIYYKYIIYAICREIKNKYLINKWRIWLEKFDYIYIDDLVFCILFC